MIIGYIKGQELQLKSELIVADTIDYLTAKFVFKTADWQGLSKWAHFKKGDTVYDIPLTADSITKSDHLNLAAGEWEVYLHGNAFDGGEVVERITTEVAKLTVKGTGTLDGEPFPEIPASETERINAELSDHEERITYIEEHGGGGGGTTDHRELTNRDTSNQHPMSAISGLEDALDSKQPSGDYATSGELDALADIVDGKGTYSKPSGGIPKTDLASDVQTSLGKADTALQPSDTVESEEVELADVATSGDYNDLINKPTLFSGNYNDLTNKPTIPTVPTNVSAFTNDSGYLTLATLPKYNGEVE